MRYIESVELREWVKENLRKTIFQKAHALAIQTGCDILVKLHDKSDIAGCQYYGTSSLKKLYRSSKLRQPGETLVSGETGLPLRDKCIQSGSVDTSEGMVGVETERLIDDSYNGGVTDGATHPMELTETGGEFASSDVADAQTQGSQFDPSQEESYTDSDMQIKTEALDVEQQEQFTTPSEELDIKPGPPSELEISDTSLNVAGPETSTPTTSRLLPSMSSSAHVQRYAVPISPKPYQCSICQKTFRSIQILQKHTLTFHSRPRSTLPLSRGRGKGRSKGHGLQYFRHQQSQEDLEPKGYHCVMCNRSFRSPESLQDHVTQVHMGMAIPQLQATSQEQIADNMDPSMIPSQLQTSEPRDDPIAGTSSPQTEGTSVSMAQFQSLESPALVTSQGSSSAFNLSAASTSSSFSQSSPGRQGTPSKGGEETSGTDSKRALPTIQTVMAGILLAAGPVVSRRLLSVNSKALVYLTKQQFEDAAENLAQANMGMVVKDFVPRRRSFVFIKRPPFEISGILEELGLLVTYEKYEQRYNLAIPPAISANMLNKLQERGFVFMRSGHN